MTKSLKYIATSMLFACGCLFSMAANASVCFIPNNNCSGTSVSGIDIDARELETKCKALGYTTKKEECINHYNIGGVCPYDNRWVICCAPQFNYPAPCVHPLTQVAKCGSRYQCECAKNFKYYMASTVSGSVCTNYKTNGPYPRAYTDGNYCALVTSDDQGHESGLTLYERCVCDATMYPKTDDTCKQEDPNTECGGDTCVSSEIGTQCSICKCQEKFSKRRSTCTFGIKRGSPICTQGNIDYVESNACCDCPSGSFPYTSTSDHTAVKEYEACSIVNHCEGSSTERYRAKTCQNGYKLDTTGTKCIEQGCFDAIQEYLETGKSPDWELYKPGTKPTKTKVVVADDTGYNNVQWNHFYNKKVYSGAYFAAKAVSGSDIFTQAVKNVCKKIPVITVSGGDYTSTGYLDFTSVELYSPYSWWNEGGFKCTNCTLDLFAYYNEADTLLEYDSGNSINANNMVADIYKVEAKTSGADFIARGYDFQIGTGNFYVTNFTPRSTDSNADNLGNTSLFTPNNIVSISGDSGRRVRFDLPSGYLLVNGGMTFNYADVYIKNTYIGPKSAGSTPKCDNGGRCHNCGCATRSFITPYNTRWYIYDRDTYTSNNLYVSAGSYLGVPAGNKDAAYSTTSGVQIIFPEDTIVQALGVRLGRNNSEDDQDCWGGGYKKNDSNKEALSNVVYLTQNGYTTSYTADNRGYGNPICVGIGHQSSQYNAIIRWSGTTNSNGTYYTHLSGSLPSDRHGCLVCYQP